MSDPRGLHGAWQQHQRLAFPAPSADLAAHVERYWVVSWDYGHVDAAEPYRQIVVPFPQVHLTFHEGRAIVSGVSSGHRVKVLHGRGDVFGVAFRPGLFRPFLGSAVSTITDTELDAHEIFGDRPIPRPADVDSVETYLRHDLPDPDPRGEEAARLVDLVAATPSLTRVDALAREASLTVRGLQRLFADHVGIGPKWVIRRYRLREVTERMAEGTRLDWAGIAAELGYADQAHLTRDFRAVFGEPPSHYAQRY